MKNKFDLKSSLVEIEEFNQKPPAARPAARADKSEVAKRLDAHYGNRQPESRESRKATKPKAKPQKLVQVVRDNWTHPHNEARQLEQLIQRAKDLGAKSNKNEVVRAGLLALYQMTDTEFAESLRAIPSVKTGRPKQITKSQASKSLEQVEG
jgi:hypothetical protein